MPTLSDADQQLREAAIAFVERTKEAFGGVVTYDEMCKFRFEGEVVFIMSAPGLRGIMTPRGRDVAISVRTAYSADPTRAPYADEVGSDGYPRYKWQGTDGAAHDNKALRNALVRKVPLIWFRGVAKGVYDASVVYVIDEEPHLQQFVLALDLMARELWEAKAWAPADLALRQEYALRLVKERVHQPAFRQAVMAAYRGRCALCRLQHSSLLDAAHIREDSRGGQPIVTNGIAMCAIHHRAFDASVIGISPDYRVDVQPRVLKEHDGPTLQHALQEMLGVTIELPKNPAAHPDKVLLAERYERFRAAS